MTEDNEQQHKYDDLLELLSHALDEIYRLRGLAAFEARVIEAQALDLKSLAKCRRNILEHQVELLREAARGESSNAYWEIGGTSMKRELKASGASVTLTRYEWEQEIRGTR